MIQKIIIIKVKRKKIKIIQNQRIIKVKAKEKKLKKMKKKLLILYHFLLVVEKKVMITLQIKRRMAN